MSFTKPLTGVRKVQTRRGDTLQAIAARELGDAARWPDLITLNNLAAPYLTDDPAQAGPRVLLAGVGLLVPSVAPPATGVADSVSLFGADVALTQGRLTAGDDGDLLTVAETPNLVQALGIRLETEPGELLFHADYGCQVHSLLGRKAGPVVNQLAATFVARALRSDPRVARVDGATATVQGDTVAASAVAVAVDGKDLPVGLNSGARR